MRDGTAAALPVRDLVPGDIVLLTAGDLVSADGLVLSANSAQVNQAALTGEPFPVGKSPGTEPDASMAEASNLLLHGSSMIGGSATMLVVQTGDRTHFGGIARSLGNEQPPTAFERGIHRLGLLIVRMTVFLVLFAMALAVGLTPELLPMIMTIGLARGAQRMAAAKVVVKRLSAIHDLGEMDILCTDKTGTLTEARIMVTGHPGIDGRDSERVFDLAAVNAQFESGLRSPLDDACLRIPGIIRSPDGGNSTSARSISSGGGFRCWPNGRANGSRSSRARPKRSSAFARRPKHRTARSSRATPP